MTKQEEIITEANYQALIIKAFDCDENKHGAHYSFMRNLIWTERGASGTKHLSSYDKQLEKIKSNLSKALKKLSTNKLYSNEVEFFDLANERLKNSYSTSDLGMVINDVVEKIHQD